MIAYKNATVWKQQQDETYAKAYFSGVYIEIEAASDTGLIGDNPEGELRAWFFSNPCIYPGDYIKAGTSNDQEPPQDAFRVRSIKPYSTRHKMHHTEVIAR